MSKSIETLNKPNELISIISERNISITQRRAYNIFLKKAQDKLKFEDYKGNIFQVPCSELYQASNIKNKNKSYVEEEEIDNLMTTLVKIRDKDNPKNWKAFNLLSYVDKRDDFFYFELNSFIINSLKEQTFFTPLDLLMTNSLSSQYSVLFYELAIRYEKYKIPKMTIQEVRELTGTSNEYSRMFDFKKNVLDVACAEITEKTDIILKYETIKSGRTISHIDFKIAYKKDNFLNVDVSPKIKENNSVTELFLLCKVQTDEVELFIAENIEKYTLEIFKSNINYTNKYAKDNYLAYLKKALKDDYAKALREQKAQKPVQKKLIENTLTQEEHKAIANDKNMSEESKKYLEKVNKEILKK